ncbi:reverse transcriptase domain-containing protein [Tanacetum coccineum]
MVERTQRRDYQNVDEHELLQSYISHYLPPTLISTAPRRILLFPQSENKSLTDAWLRMKEMLRNCHGHNLSKGNIIKIFYHGLNEITQEVLNATVGGIFLYKTPNQAYQLLGDKVLLKLDWAKNQRNQSLLKNCLLFRREGNSNTDTEKIMARMDAMTIKMDAQYKELQSRAKQPTPDLDDDDMPISIPSNTQSNPRGSKAYQPPQARNEHVNVVFTRSGKTYNPPDNPNEQNNSENNINFDSDDEDNEPTPQPKTQPTKPVKETPLPKPYKLKIPYPQCLRNEKMVVPNNRKFLDMIRAVRINIPLVDALAGMPNYGKFLKELISNKHKIEQISAAFLSDESSTMIQNKVPPKIGDPEKDSKVPLILGQPFLHTADAVIRVKQKQLNLGVGTEQMIFNIYSAMKHSYSNDDTYFSIDVIDEILEEYFNALLDEGSKILHSIEGTLLEEEIFYEFDEFLAMTADEKFCI